MKRMQASEFDPRRLTLYDGYVHGELTKREFLRGASQYVAAGVTALGALEILKPNYALANQVAEDDPSIKTSIISYDSPLGHGKIDGLMAMPSFMQQGMARQLPTVLAVHENRGLNPYIKDVVRRLAKRGFLAFGPDGLTPLGGYPGNDDDGRAMQKKLDRTKLTEDFFAAFEFLLDHPASNGRVGAIGFCYGGGICNALAVSYSNLGAAVPFYGRQPSADSVPMIKAPLMLHYASLDERINKGWPPFKEALDANNKSYEAYIYDKVNHGFHNDTTPRYDKMAAELAWNRSVNFLHYHLG